MDDREIHPAVDAAVIQAKKEKQQRLIERQARRLRMDQEHRERVTKRARETFGSLLLRMVIVIAFVVLMVVLQALSLISPPLVIFLASAALYWFAICLGAGLQYVFCERGYLK